MRPAGQPTQLRNSLTKKGAAFCRLQTFAPPPAGANETSDPSPCLPLAENRDLGVTI